MNCPACGVQSETHACPACGADLSAVLQVVHRAAADYSSAWRLADQNCIELAFPLAVRAAELGAEQGYRTLAGWCAFWIGEYGDATRFWGEQWPNAANVTADYYNRALASARSGDWSEASKLLEHIDMPMTNVVRLRLAVQQALGIMRDEDEVRITRDLPLSSLSFPGNHTVSGTPPSPIERSRRARTLTLFRYAFVATVGFALGAAVFRGAFNALGSDGGNVSGPASIGTAPPNGSPTTVDLLAALAEENAMAFAAGVRPSDLKGSALRDIIEISERTKRRIGRRWYVEGYNAYVGNTLRDAEVYLTAAVALVGAADTSYWVDDALYQLMHLLKDSSRDGAITVATLLQDYQSRSMFNNSITASLAKGM